MHFDGAVSKKGVGVGICITGLEFEYRSFSYKFFLNIEIFLEYE